MKGCLERAAIGLLVACLAGGAALADDLDHSGPARKRANAAIDVIKAANVTPSDACVSALQDMQSTEQQLLALNGQVEETGSAREANHQSELDIARDVMASDIDNTSTSCGADADAACGTADPSAKLAQACTALRAASKGGAAPGP